MRHSNFFTILLPRWMFPDTILATAHLGRGKARHRAAPDHFVPTLSLDRIELSVSNRFLEVCYAPNAQQCADHFRKEA